jgi:hypothetical protein
MLVGTMIRVSQSHCSRKWLLPFLAAFVAVLATLLSSATASAATTGVAETRVGASAVVLDKLVEPPRDVRAGQGLGKDVAGSQIVVATGVAAKSADDGVDLFRHVSPDELADIGKNGFRPGAGSLDGKWFAESGEHAAEWGRVLNGGNGSVVKVRAPTSFGNQLMRLEKLDGMGPARYVEPHQLAQLNRYGRGIW